MEYYKVIISRRINTNTYESITVYKCSDINEFNNAVETLENTFALLKNFRDTEYSEQIIYKENNMSDIYKTAYIEIRN